MSPLLELLMQYKLAFVLPAAFALGPTASLASGFLLRLDVFTFFPLYFSLMAGELIGDIMWYWIGRRYGHPFIQRFGKYFSVTEEHVETTERLFRKYHSTILILSKLTTGFGFAIVVLFTAGLSRVSFRKYFLINFVGQFFWTALLLAIGYFTTHFYLSVQGLFERMSLIACLIVIACAFVGFGRYLIARLDKNV